jgi:hypothetical protein
MVSRIGKALQLLQTYIWALLLAVAVVTIVIGGISWVAASVPTTSLILIGAGAFLFGFVGLMPVTVVVRRALAPPPPPPPPAAPAPAQTSAPPPPTATGETTLGQVLDMPTVAHPYELPDLIDYYAEPATKRWERLNGLLKLTLGEIALLRRLAVAPGYCAIERKCMSALGESGGTHPAGALSHLEGTEMVTIDNDLVTLTDAGRECVWAFTQWLTHNPRLVFAYRLVTPKINRKVRFDGRPPG